MTSWLDSDQTFPSLGKGGGDEEQDIWWASCPCRFKASFLPKQADKNLEEKYAAAKKMQKACESPAPGAFLFLFKRWEITERNN